MRFRQWIVIGLCGLGLVACSDDVDSCEAIANVNFVFYNNTCVSTWVECDGEEQPRSDSDRGGEFCDLENDFCTGPDRRETAIRHYTPDGRACELCTSGGGRRCTPLPAGCGEHTLEHVGSGSPDAGTDPTLECGDAGV